MLNRTLKNTFALSIKNSALTAVELSVDAKNKIRMVNFAQVNLEPGIIEDHCIVVDAQAFSQAINQLINGGKNGPFKPKNIIISFPEEKTFSHRFSVPADKLDDEAFILKTAEDFIPIDLRGAVVDYRTLDKDLNQNQVTIEFVAAQKNMIQPLIDSLSSLGLNVLFVDVNKNSLTRACHNPFQSIDDDFMLIHLDESVSMTIIQNASGASYSMNSPFSGHYFAVKLNESSHSPLPQLKQELLYSTSDHSQEWGIVLNPLFDSFLIKIKELYSVAKVQSGLQPKKIYLMGPYARIPGFADVLQKTFAPIEIIFGLDYLHFEGAESFIDPQLGGLALRSLFSPNEMEEINLLPPTKKEALFDYFLTPFIRKFLVTTSFILMILALASGGFFIGTYAKFKITEKEVAISLEKTENPYLIQVAKEKQQKDQLSTQIDNIIFTALPPVIIIEKMEAYNDEQIQLVNAHYQLKADESASMRLSARVESRFSTEALVDELEKDTFFEKVISPLSNLTGKGERLINIDLTIGIRKLMADLIENQKVKPTEGNEGQENLMDALDSTNVSPPRPPKTFSTPLNIPSDSLIENKSNEQTP